MHLREIRWDGMDWIDLAQDRDRWRALVNTVMNLWIQYDAGKFLSSFTIGGFSRRARLHEWVIKYLKPGHGSQDYWVFWTFPSFGILEIRIHDVSETDSVSETLCFLVSRIPDDGKVKKKTGILCVIHHRQNPSESTGHGCFFSRPSQFIIQSSTHSTRCNLSYRQRR
jgi:hypothetical protein